MHVPLPQLFAEQRPLLEELPDTRARCGCSRPEQTCEAIAARPLPGPSVRSRQKLGAVLEFYTLGPAWTAILKHATRVESTGWKLQDALIRQFRLHFPTSY